MLELSRLIAGLVVQLGATFLAQRWLLARMDAERRGRAWNGISWAMALLWVGPLSMIPFCWVTRPARGARAAALALATGGAQTAALLVASTAIDWLVATALGLPT